jgi:hypothetical protein
MSWIGLSTVIEKVKLTLISQEFGKKQVRPAEFESIEELQKYLVYKNVEKKVKTFALLNFEEKKC